MKPRAYINPLKIFIINTVCILFALTLILTAVVEVFFTPHSIGDGNAERQVVVR